MRKLKKPTKKTSTAYEFNEVMHYLEEKTGKSFRDYAGKFSKEGKAENDKLLDTWLADNGYAGKRYVLDMPQGSNKDWAENSEEMKLRVEINTKYRDVEKTNERPYLDFWHWMCDSNEISNGGWLYLPDWSCMTDPDVEPWKKEILQHFRDFLGDDYDERMRVEW